MFRALQKQSHAVLLGLTTRTHLPHPQPPALALTPSQWIHEIEDEEPTGYIRYDKFESLMLR
jgi:hypothetical protein